MLGVPPVVGQEPGDELFALVRARVVDKGFDLIGSWKQTDGVEINTAREQTIIDEL